MTGRDRSHRFWAAVTLACALPAGILLGAWLTGPRGNGETRGSGAAEASAATLAGVEDVGPVDRAGGGASRARAGAPTADPRAAWRAPSARQEAAGPPSGSRRWTPIVEATRRVAPSVVSITVLRRVGTTPRDPFDLFRLPRSRTVQGLGSGFAIDSAGYILTNDHVVRDADSLVVTDARGRRFPAELVGSDELTDIAVLRIDADRVPPAPLGTSSDLMVGEPTVALGNPFGYLLANSEATVTSGVISGIGRDIRSEREGRTLLADMVQTDAAINPGNSGGPLVNAEGEVIGVNSSIFSRSGGSEGLGFAIPIDRALRIADELRRFGRIRRPWVGIVAAAVPSDTLFSLTEVQEVAPGSPADRAGIRQGDLLAAIGGRPVDSPLDLEVGLLDAGVGSEVPLTVRRDGRTRRLEVSIEELPSDRAERVEVLRGLELVTVTPQIVSERRLRVESGALIVGIAPNASRVTGMREGDVILAVNRSEVDTAEEAADLFQYHAGRGRIRVTVYRDGRYYYSLFSLR